MKRPGNLQDIISRAGSSGWDFFKELPEEIAKRTALAQQQDAETKRTIARAWAEFSQTPGGAIALQALFDSTLNRTVFFVSLGMKPDEVGVWGAFREGQNSLAHAIAREIAAGLESEDPPKPRDI